jgi:signal peptidase I
MTLKKKNAAWIVLSLTVVAAWFVTLRPASLGGPAGYVMVRGVSMLPTYKGGDLVITHKASSYAKGDIVAFKVPKGDFGEGVVVIHRIVDGSAEDGFILQGDNNGWRDDWRAKPKDIVGKSWVHAPKIGLVLGFLHAPVPLASLAVALVAVFVLVPKRREEEDEEEAFGPVALPVAKARVEPKLARDDHALDLARPLADLEDLRVSVEAGHGELLDVAVPAVHLNRFARHVDGHLGREELRHGRLGLERFTVLTEAASVVDGETGVMDLRRHVGDLELDGLEAADGLAELVPFPRVANAGVETPLRLADGERRDRDAAVVELRKELVEPLSDLA